MNSDVKDLSPEEQALHMLKQWVSRENASYGELFLRLNTIPLFHYASHTKHNDLASRPPASVKHSTSQLSCTDHPSGQPSFADDTSRQSPSNDRTIGKPQLFSSESTSVQSVSIHSTVLHSPSSDCSSRQPPSHGRPISTDWTSEQPSHVTATDHIPGGPHFADHASQPSGRQNSSGSTQPLSADVVSWQQASTSQLSHSSSQKRSLQDDCERPTKMRRKSTCSNSCNY